MTRNMPIARRTRLAISIVAALVVSAFAFATVAEANPAPYWGGINTASYAEKAYGWVGSDCTIAVGSHNLQSVYPSNGRAQAAGTIVCDGTRYHNMWVRVQYYAAANGAWYLQTQSSWVYWAGTPWGMGYSYTLYSPASCAPSYLPASTWWLARIEYTIDGNYGHVDTVPKSQWPGGPNRC